MESRYLACMSRLFDMDDRARLRERFFGATHAVLARL
ncbi:MAG: isopropylmalate isomerase [Pseudomonadota bacterium]